MSESFERRLRALDARAAYHGHHLAVGLAGDGPQPCRTAARGLAWVRLSLWTRSSVSTSRLAGTGTTSSCLTGLAEFVL